MNGRVYAKLTGLCPPKQSMPTFFFFEDGQLKRELSVCAGACVLLCCIMSARLTVVCAPQFSGADESLLRGSITKLSEL
jgi:hypothetical protein